MSAECSYQIPRLVADLPLDRHVVIEASAGTGKTYTIEHLVVDLLFQTGARIDEILVVTFTERATAELRSRIRDTLRRLLELEANERGDEGPVWEIDDVRRQILRDALADLDFATIATIHGFCDRVLAEEAFAARLPFDLELVDRDALFPAVYRAVLRQALADPGRLGTALARYRRQGQGLAGGDHERRLERLVRRCVSERGALTPAWDPEALHAAADELATSESHVIAAAVEFATERFTARAGSNARSKLGELVEAARHLLADGDPFEFAECFAKWSTSQFWKRPALEHFLELIATTEAPAPGHLGEILETFERHAVPLEAYLAQRLAARVERGVIEHKRRRGLYDYDDMLDRVHEAVCGASADAGLVASLRRRYRFALVDEFQDTDRVQWDIFRTIFVEGTVDGDGEHRIFIVGDPKQSIFGFRSADLDTYFAAVDHLTEKNRGARLPLTENFRATEPLVTATNRIFESGVFSGRLREFEPVDCGAASERRAVGPGGEMATPVHVVQLTTSADRLRIDDAVAGYAAFVAAEIDTLVSRRSLFFGAGDDPEPLSYRDVFVLVSKNRRARELGDRLRRRGIPVTYRTRDSVFDTPEAGHVLKLLEHLADPDHEPSRLALLLTPLVGVPLRHLLSARDLPHAHPVTERLLRWQRLAESERWNELFTSVLGEGGLARRLLVAPDGERRLLDYQTLFDRLRDWTQGTARSPYELASRLRQRMDDDGSRAPDGDAQVSESDRDAVRILTVHAAKGLQAPVVFLAVGWSGRGSSDLSVYHREGRRYAHIGTPLGRTAELVERERQRAGQRLLYVAATRARARLYLPLFDVESTTFRGSYQILNERLRQLCDDGLSSSLFVERVVSCDRERLDDGDRLAAWSLPFELLELEPEDDEEFARLRRLRSGAEILSYSRLHRAPETIDEETFHHQLMAGEDELVVDETDDPLPSGRRAGLFLHAVLEHVDLASLDAGAGPSAWSAGPEVSRLLDREADRHGFDDKAKTVAARLVYRALTSPLEVDGLSLPDGLRAPRPRQAELEFTFRIAAQTPPVPSSSTASGDGRGVTDPAYVRGIVDLVFEHRGRVYFLDWKSDRLADWDAARIEAHVAERYETQARLYALAIVRAYGIDDEDAYRRRFGGILYAFLRGYDPPPEEPPIWYRRPTWEEISSWERWLARLASSASSEGRP